MTRSTRFVRPSAAARRALAVVALLGLASSVAAQTLHYGATAQGYSNALTLNDQTGVSGPFGHSQHATGGALYSSATDVESNTSTLSADGVVSSPTGTDYPVTFRADDTAAFSGEADLGALHATAEAVSRLTPLAATVQGYDDNGDPFSVSSVSPLQAYGAGDMALAWQDIFTVTPTAGLPAGSVVDLRATLHFDGSISAGQAADLVNVSTSLFFDPVARYAADQDPYLFTLSGGLGAFDQAQSQTLRVLAGVPYVIGSTLDVHIGSDTGDGRSAAKVGLDQTLVNLRDTSAFTLDVLTPGAHYTTESGHGYALAAAVPAAVPEAGTLSALVSGLACLGVCALRRARRGDA